MGPLDILIVAVVCFLKGRKPVWAADAAVCGKADAAEKAEDADKKAYCEITESKTVSPEESKKKIFPAERFFSAYYIKKE